MDSCCDVTISKKPENSLCPVCQQKGKSVQIITLKALLKPSALETIDPKPSYAFCTNPACDVVYFADEQTFGKDAVKVPVFQKDMALDVPVCYCFGWTRERLTQAVLDNERPIEHISEQVQANRCGCEVNNPQGACCMGNVAAYIRRLSG